MNVLLLTHRLLIARLHVHFASIIQCNVHPLIKTLLPNANKYSNQITIYPYLTDRQAIRIVNTLTKTLPSILMFG